MQSCEFSEGDGSDEWANFQETEEEQCLPTIVDPLTEYNYEMGNTVTDVCLGQISVDLLKHHRITITHNTNISEIFNFYEKDCYITIKKRHHYGTHCIYDVVLANFTLEIHLLNLHRSSDDNDASLSENEIGKGGFGSVRVVKAGNSTLAVKRINFMTKAKSVDGFDIETESAECKQIQKAIRQYCLYKICSMLKIGPEVIFKSNYDLICFNNCIEFMMELCETPSKGNFLRSRNLSIDRMKRDLMSSLKLLHSLSIIHRDIKPDNILFSDSQQRFVFTDFGITHAVKELPHQKTMTGYGGTPDYCGQEMKGLLNGGQGLVNLYLNDLYGLQKTIAEFEASTALSEQLSSNQMSFKNESQGMSGDYEEEAHLSGPLASFEEWFEKSDISLSPKKESSNIYISSTHSLDAPARSASEINFFQSLILYEILETSEAREEERTSVWVNKVIDGYIEEIGNSHIESEIRRYVLAIFYPSEVNSDLTLKIVDLKNTARNFGPKHEETLEKIDQILLQVNFSQQSDISHYFKELKESIINNPECYETGRFEKEMMIHLYLKNYNYFIGCCIRIMRETARFITNLKERETPSTIDQKVDRSFLCKIYITCQRSNALTIQENKIINELFLKLWWEDEISELLQEHKKIQDQLESNAITKYYYAQDPGNSRFVARTMKFAVDYMMMQGRRSSFEVLNAFNFFIYRFNWTSSEDFTFYLQFLTKIQDFWQKNEESENSKVSLKVETVKIYRKICRIQNHPELEKNYYIDRIKTIIEELRGLSNKKHYFICSTQLIWIYLENRELNHLTLDPAFATLRELDEYNCLEIEKQDVFIQINNVIGNLYHLQGSYDDALTYLRNAERFILSRYGKENLMLSYYQCQMNISLALYKKGELQNALASYQAVLAYLERTKKVLSYEKSFIYRAIIVIRLEMGVDKSHFPEIDELIRNIVYETIFTLVSLTTSEFELRNYILDLSIFNFIHTSPDLNVRIFVMKTLLKYIEDHLKYFIIPYDKINYQLNRIYTNTLKMPIKALKYVWNYIKIKINDFHDVTSEDFRLMNDFVGKLVKGNSSRRALIILKKYIFHIPLSEVNEREKAFRLFHRVHSNLSHPFEKVIYQLIARECEVLTTRNFSRIYRDDCTHAGRMTNILLGKWLSRI